MDNLLRRRDRSLENENYTTCAYNNIYYLHYIINIIIREKIMPDEINMYIYIIIYITRVRIFVKKRKTNHALYQGISRLR